MVAVKKLSVFHPIAHWRGMENRFVLALALLTFALWLGASAILPMLPLYLTKSGSGSLGVGVVMSAYYIGAVLTQIPAGKLVDAIGPAPVIVSGLCVFGLASVSFALIHGIVLAVIFRSLQGIGAGAVTVACLGAVSATVERGRKGASLGMIYGSQMMATALGPVIGSIVGTASLRLLFVSAGLLGILTAVFSGFYFFMDTTAKSIFFRHGLYPGNGADRAAKAPEPIPALLGTEAAAGEAKNIFFRGYNKIPFLDKKSKSRFAAGLLAFSVLGYLPGSYEAFWALYLHMRHASSPEIGLSWTLFALPYALLAVPAGHLAEHKNKKLLMVITLVWSGAFASLYPELHLVPLIIGLAVFEAMGAVLASPTATLLISDSVHASWQGRAQGMAATLWTLFAGVGALLGGALFSVSYGLPFFVLTALLVLIALFQLFLL